MEPLESTAIHLIQRSLLRFIRMLPAGRVSARDIAAYNDQQDLDAAQIRDFLILHYKVTTRRASPFWRHCAEMPHPAPPAQTLELFPEQRRVLPPYQGMSAPNTLAQVKLGPGVDAAK